MNHNPEPDGYPLKPMGRALLAAGGLSLLAGFLVAYRLEPDPRGFGTHQRLGLPPCTIQVVFGIRCPSCGMTTSFASFTKGRFGAAAQANVGGLLLALLCGALIPWCGLSAYYGRLCWVRRPDVAAVCALGAVCIVAALDWAVRVLVL
jgi:hypothetical protein